MSVFWRFGRSVLFAAPFKTRYKTFGPAREVKYVTRHLLSTSIYVVLVFTAISSRIWTLPLCRDIGVALTVAFLALEISRTPPFQRNVGICLAAIGAIAAWAGGDLFGALYDGLDKRSFSW